MAAQSSPLTIDEARRELRVGRRAIDLEPRVFDLVAYLAAHPERVVPKDELLDAVWPDVEVGDGSLQRAVSIARAALRGAGLEDPIRTFARRGYRFCLETPEECLVRAGADPADSVAEARDTGEVMAHSLESASSPIETASGEAGAPAPFGVHGTTFVGRDEELGRLMQLILTETRRLVTIVGPGGVGKTTIAAQVLSRLDDAGREVRVASLGDVQSLHGLHVAIAEALGLSLSRGDAGSIAEAIGARRVVLILDNFEQLVSVGATTVGTLIARTSGLQVVVTTREVLGLREEWIVPIGGLPTQPVSDSREPSDAERLYLDREAQSGASWTGAASDEYVRETCRLVDGMPLALELAAALRRYLTRSEVCEYIRKDIDALQSETKNIPLRHRTMRGLFEESCRRLSEEQLLALLALSVFSGSFALRAAEDVAGLSLPVLGALVDKSLLQRRDDRFSMHPLLRQYARERLGGLNAGLQKAHATHYLSALGRLAPELEGPGQMNAAALIDPDSDEMMAAWHWACENRAFGLIEDAAYGLYLHSQIRSRWLAVRPAFERAVDAALEGGADAWPALARVLVPHIWSVTRTTPGPAVAEASRRAQALFAEHETEPPPGFATDPEAIDANIFWAGGRYARMLDAAQSSEARARNRGDRAGHVYALWLGAVARHRMLELRCEPRADGQTVFAPADGEQAERLDDAAGLLRESLRILEEMGEVWFRSSVLREMAFNAKARGDLAGALRHLEEVLAARTAFGDSWRTAEALIEVAGTRCNQNEPALAVECCLRAEPLVASLGDPGLAAELHRVRAMTALTCRDFGLATEACTNAVEVSCRIGSTNNLLGTLPTVGHLFELTGDMAGAAAVFTLLGQHPGSPPFARAMTRAALERIRPALSEVELRAISEQAMATSLVDFVTETLTRLSGLERPT
jgi:predicted ATPase/DNA-binding winged helix-turn-helix (wHTH) protein